MHSTKPPDTSEALAEALALAEARIEVRSTQRVIAVSENDAGENQVARGYQLRLEYDLFLKEIKVANIAV